MDEPILQNPEPKKSKLPVFILAGLAVVIALVAIGYFFIIKQPKQSDENQAKLTAQQPYGDSSQNPLPQKQTPVSPEGQTYAAAPKILFYSNYGLKMWSDNNFTAVADFSQSSSSVADIAVSPNAQKYIYGYYNYDRDGGAAGMFSSGINSLAVADFLGSQAAVKGEQGKTAKWNLQWSPDSSKVSYTVNDGKALEILDVLSGKVLLHLDGAETSPVSWLSGSVFSFVQDHKLYTGTINNPKEKVISDNVYNSLCTFEDPPFLVAPNWSQDFRFVGYFTKDSYIVKDTQTGNTAKAKTTQNIDDAGICGNSVNISVIGWDIGNNFYFSTGTGGNNRVVYQMVLPGGGQEKFENLFAGPGTTLTQISPDGRYFVFAPAPSAYSQNFRNGFTINNSGKDGDRVCNNGYAFTSGPVSTASNSWSKKSPNVVVILTPLPDGYVLTPFDVQTCKVLANIIIPETYGPNGMSFAGAQ